MGQITRTNFGLTKTRVIANADVITLPTVSVELVAAIPGAMLMPIAVFISASLTAIYTNIDAASVLNVGPGGLGFPFPGEPPIVTWREAIVGNVSQLLAFIGTNIAAGSLEQVHDETNDVNSSMAFGQSTSVGQPLLIRLNNVLSGDLQDGDPANTLTVTVFYNVIPVA